MALYDAILFDLGGVLIELGEHPFPPSWLEDEAAFNGMDWFHSETALAFESGLISAHEFATAFIQDLKLAVTPEEFITEFTAWPKAVFPEVESLLIKLKPHYTLAVLSNSNEIHWPRVLDEFAMGVHIAHLFSSHLMKTAKPKPEAFQYVLNTLNVDAEKVLFFDDNAFNIAQAKALGIHAVQVTNAKEIETYLTQNEEFI